jgi:hypothetical protein
MKKVLLFSCVNLFLVHLHAQVGPGDQKTEDKKSNTPTATETHSYFAAGGAYYFLPLDQVNDHLNVMGIKTGFQNAIGVGLERGYSTVTSKLTHAITGMLAFHYLLPQHVNSPGDSVKATLNGYNAQFDLIGANFLKSEKTTLTAGLGWAFGRLKLTENAGSTKTIFLNKYFAPELRFEFNVRLADHFYIGIRDAYRFDITNPAWLKNGPSGLNINTTKMNGNMVGAFIGYGK